MLFELFTAILGSKSLRNSAHDPSSSHFPLLSPHFPPNPVPREHSVSTGWVGPLVPQCKGELSSEGHTNDTEDPHATLTRVGQCSTAPLPCPLPQG